MKIINTQGTLQFEIAGVLYASSFSFASSGDSFRFVSSIFDVTLSFGDIEVENAAFGSPDELAAWITGFAAPGRKLNEANILDYHTGGDDYTAALNAAFAAFSRVYAPAGEYMCGNLTIQHNQILRGDGAATVLRFNPDSDGIMIDATGKSVTIREISFHGGQLENYSAWVTGGTRSCIQLDAALNFNLDNSLVERVSIRGFNGRAIGMNGNQTPYLSGPIVTHCDLKGNFIGIDTGVGGVNGAEYVRILGNSIIFSAIAINVNSGNVNISGVNSLSTNGIGVRINGGVGNGSHGIFANNLCNHNITSLSISDAIYGFTVTGNQFYHGNIEISNSKGVNMCHNTIAAETLTLSDNGWNDISDNWFPHDTQIIGSTAGLCFEKNWSEVAGAYL